MCYHIILQKSPVLPEKNARFIAKSPEKTEGGIKAIHEGMSMQTTCPAWDCLDCDNCGVWWQKETLSLITEIDAELHF